MKKLRVKNLIFFAAGVVFVLALLTTGGVAWLLKTASGRRFVRGYFVSLVLPKVHGKLYVGDISGDLLSHPRIDSLEIRDEQDSVLVATGAIEFRFDFLDLWNKRVAIRGLTIQGLLVHLRRDSTGIWTYKKVFPRGAKPNAPVTSVGRRGWDYAVLDSVSIRDGEFRWTDPWQPSSWYDSAERDSVIRLNLARTDVDVKRVGPGLVKARHWRGLQLDLPHVRLIYPDSDGVDIVLARMDVDGNDPPFNVHSAHGHVLVVHDTVRVNIAGFKLPGSSGSAKGELFTKRGLGVRVRVIGDTVAMNDIAWLYPTLPTEGGGTMVLDIRKDSTLDHVDWALSKMDVQSKRSRLLGAMTFGSGQEILAVTDVALALAPVDFKLIEQFNGGPLPFPWAGQLTGRVFGRGGPITNFDIDSAAINFADANVPGVVNRATGFGQLDILSPINTAFHDFALNVQHFDLRTARALNPKFPPYVGRAYGTARLDSVWWDVRFRGGDMYYAADSFVNHFTGDGRVTTGKVEMIYDLALTADPMILDAFTLTYPKFPMRGVFRGPFTMKGGWNDMLVAGEMTGAGGHAKGEARIDDLAPRYGIDGHVDLTNVDPSRVFVGAEGWKGILNGRIEAAVTGDSLANVQGGLKVALDRSLLRDVRIQSGNARVTLGEGYAHVDSLALFSNAFAVQGKGGLGLHVGVNDSLGLTLQMDSLGGLRPLLPRRGDVLAFDSLAGAATASARLFGNLDTLALTLAVRGNRITYGTTHAARAALDADIRDLTHTNPGTVTLTADTGSVGGVQFSRINADGVLSGDRRATVGARLTNATGPGMHGNATLAWDTLSLRTALDSFELHIGDHVWALAHPAHVLATRDGFVLDTLELTGEKGAGISLSLAMPDSMHTAGTLSARLFPLGDLGKLFQIPVPVSGATAVAASIGGSRNNPVMRFEVRAQDAQLGEARVEGLHASGEYRERALTATVEYTARGATVLTGKAVLPLDLSLHAVARRKLDAPLSGSLDADTANLGVIEAFTSALRRVSGRLDAHLRLAGTWTKPLLTGPVSVTRGAFSMPSLGATRYDNVGASVRFLGDSIQIDSIAAHSGVRPDSRASLLGHISYADRLDPSFLLRLKAHEFKAIDDPAFAQLTITTDATEGLRLTGKQSSSDLIGALVADGKLYVPESYRKNVIVINDPDYLRDIDTLVASNRKLIPSAPPAVVRNMRAAGVDIRAGNNLRLISEEANIKLGGGLKVTQTYSDRASDRGKAILALYGALTADEGTYRLSLGPVQRTFTVVPGGAVRFFGDADNNPALENISAIYTVRQYDQRDVRQAVRIQATLGGTLLQPTVTLLSPDSLRISNADKISYLITGSPSFEIGRTADYSTLAWRGLVSSAGSILGSRLTGGFFNEVEIRTSDVEAGYSGGLKRASQNILSGTRVGLGREIRPNLSGRLDLGLCQLGQFVGGGTFDPAGLLSSTGAKLDLRLADGLTVSGGLDPATSAVVCAQGWAARGFVPTPRQVGLDFFRTWRF